MSSTAQATSSYETVKLIIDALANYTNETGVDLSKNILVVNHEEFRSPEAILQLFEEREKAFREYRMGMRLTNCLKPAVKVLFELSGILDEAASPVSPKCHLVGRLLS